MQFLGATLWLVFLVTRAVPAGTLPPDREGGQCADRPTIVAGGHGRTGPRTYWWQLGPRSATWPLDQTSDDLSAALDHFVPAVHYDLKSNLMPI